MEKSIFEKALSDFVNGFAADDEIRHMADAGMTVPEIRKRLSFPKNETYVAQVVWNHYVRNGTILLESPGRIEKRTETIRESGPYGRVSYRQVTTAEVLYEKDDYVICDFSKLIGKNQKEIIKPAELDGRDWDYIRYLPWPSAPVWHRADERILRIIGQVNNIKID